MTALFSMPRSHGIKNNDKVGDSLRSLMVGNLGKALGTRADINVRARNPWYCSIGSIEASLLYRFTKLLYVLIYLHYLGEPPVPCLLRSRSGTLSSSPSSVRSPIL